MLKALCYYTACSLGSSPVNNIPQAELKNSWQSIFLFRFLIEKANFYNENTRTQKIKEKVERFLYCMTKPFEIH